ncbi:hypothetical protein ACQBAT_00500 [Ornithinimicrobium sp. Y1847]
MTVKKMIVMTAAVALMLTACGPESEVSSTSTTQDNVEAGGSEDAGATQEPGGRIDNLPAATEAPDSTERGVTGRAQVEVPEGWTETHVDDLFNLRYQAGESETDPMLSLAGDFGRFRMSRSAASVLIAEIQMGTPGFTIHSQQDMDVPGASNAVRVNFSWGTEDEEAGVMDGMWILAVDSSNAQTIGLALSGGEDTLSEADFDRVADSFTMLPEQG